MRRALGSFTRALVWGVAAYAVASCGEPEIVVPDILTIVSIEPSHGAVDIGTDVQPLVYFSHPAENKDQVESSLGVDCLGTPTDDSCAAPEATGCPQSHVAAAVSYDPTAQVARITPDVRLQADTCYVIVVQPGITASEQSVGPLPVEVRSAFRTR